MSTEPSKLFDPKANLKALVRAVAIIAALLVPVWLVVRFTAGQKAANRIVGTVLQQRIELANMTVDLPASSFRTVGLSLPYTGTLSVELAVRKGNDMNVFLVTPDQIEKIKAKKNFQHIQGFEASKTRSYRRSGRVQSGVYHLVLIDKTLGILPQASTDVQVIAKLEP